MFHIHYATHLKSESRVGGRTNTALSHSSLHKALRHPTALGEALHSAHDGSVIYRWGAHLQGNPYKCHLEKKKQKKNHHQCTENTTVVSNIRSRSSERWRPALEFGTRWYGAHSGCCVTARLAAVGSGLSCPCATTTGSVQGSAVPTARTCTPIRDAHTHGNSKAVQPATGTRSTNQSQHLVGQLHDLEWKISVKGIYKSELKEVKYHIHISKAFSLQCMFKNTEHF